ncbi:unnamed protein product [Timema podura]|uniref:Plastocyanin-like domain-containing protein n=1 Tax=Timema podura TaxID=61482 RepID=A0ABN7P3A0_TIMPD|nr:unnamed protein product [Timema podura]
MVVDLIVVNNEEVNVVNNHPMHLHGHSFFVLLLGRFNEKFVFNEKTITYMYASGQLGEKTKHQPPLKDTIVIPSHGFAVIRFYTNNPANSLRIKRDRAHDSASDGRVCRHLTRRSSSGRFSNYTPALRQTTAQKIERGREGSSRRRHNGMECSERILAYVLSEVKEGLGNQINLCLDQGLNLGTPITEV